MLRDSMYTLEKQLQPWQQQTLQRWKCRRNPSSAFYNVIAKFRPRCSRIYLPLLTKNVKLFEKDICGCYYFFPQTIVPYCVYSVDGNEGPFQVDEKFNFP